MSLERVWRISKLTPNSQRNLCLMSLFKNFVLKKKEKMSLENLQTLSKLKKYACTTFLKKICAQPLKRKVVHAYFFEFGKILEIIQTHFPLFWKNDIKQRFLCEFGVSLEILQTLSKLSPNSYVFFVILFFLWKRGMSLERVWRFSKLTPNSPQTRSKLKGFHFFYFTFFFFGKEE